jgi:L-amino acid N-acyltransferase YncA
MSAVHHVRHAHERDAAGIADIYNQGIRSRSATFETRERSPDEIVAWLGNPRHPVLVAEREGEVVGWVAASSYRSRECYAGIVEFSVYVDAAARRRGVADSLMTRFIPEVRGTGAWKIVSRIFPENTASLALCYRHGFRVVGTYLRHARLDGVWRDVVIVERLLDTD